MADGYRARVDFSKSIAGLDALAGPIRESLARRMLVTGGVHLRDKAKLAAARSDPPYNPNSRGSQQPGTLSNSIYLAFDTDDSTKEVFFYNVTWSDRDAWWGKLIEFGWMRTHEVHRGANGAFYTDMSKPLPAPKPMPANPFLRPTIDTYGDSAVRLMIERGKEELPKLIQEYAAK
jgi:hypothetical protein